MWCGVVVDVPMDYQEKIDLMSAEKTGYRISRHRIVVEGVCPDCQKKETDR
jgi:Fur family transcriptional regulator, peroxide stress response regulator